MNIELSKFRSQLVIHCKTIKLLGCLLLLAVIAKSQGYKPYYEIKDAPALFEKFIKDYNKMYEDKASKEDHYQRFVKNLEIINKANAESSSATLDINVFSDYTRVTKPIYGVKDPEKDKNNN